MNATLKTNKVYELLNESDKRITVMQGGSRCFTGETLVRCVGGYKKIKDIKIGDIVQSVDYNMNISLHPVLDKFVYKKSKLPRRLITFHFIDDTELTCTENHKLLFGSKYLESVDIVEEMLNEAKWFAEENDGLVTLTKADVAKNDNFCSHHAICTEEVSKISIESSTEPVYDLMVAPYHNYIVTQRNIISHNSGKTYNILIWFIVKLLQENDKTLTIVRQSLPSIKGTVLRDFIDILSKMGIYSEDNHNKTDQIYTLNGNIIEFVSADQPQKIRGRARDYLFCNEANELSYEAWMQLIMRTENKTVIDYNPSDLSSWIYDNVIPRDDSDFYITTFRDNPFLPKELVAELERLKDADPNYWQIYGLGERGLSNDLIYTHWKTTETMPSSGEVVYGVDFGYNNPSALVKVVFYDGVIYAEELLYESRLTTNDLVDKLKQLGLGRTDEIFCDAAEPKTIEELVRNGFNAKPANKDVTEGIRTIKGNPLVIHQDSINLLKEIRNYRWKTDRNGLKLDEPIKFNDHICDALRYSVFSKLTIPSITWGAI